MNIEQFLKDKQGIKLDIACGANKQGEDWIGLDIHDFPGVDIIHDINVYPWPLPDECVIAALASHIIEHIPTVAITPDGTRFPFIEFMNELWRILKPDAQLWIAAPHGRSEGFLQDPTHCHAFNPTMFAYFDPLASGGYLYNFYRPKPWKIQRDDFDQPNVFWDQSGNIEVVLIKRRDDRSYHE